MNAHTLDQTDLDILRLLQQDARLTSKELAYKLRKGSTTIFGRVGRMKKLGYITGSLTLIDRKKFGEILIAFTQVNLTSHTCETLTAFQESVVHFPEVLECYQMTGEYDFLLKIVVNDMAGYNDFLVQKLARLANIGALESHFVITETKRELGYPLECLV
ncbi:MAG: Lrp/AsnC family transcriptional regulator [Sphingobacteriales bacterium]|nr:MAG: Lrp/AsnC family transcriptional regulator [Sphingobacteriales bacterium]